MQDEYETIGSLGRTNEYSISFDLRQAQNSFLKPKGLEQLKCDKMTFERFLKIKNTKAKKDNLISKFTCFEYKYYDWVPQTRDGACLLPIPNTYNLLLFGGTCQEPMKSVGIFKLAAGRKEADFQVIP